MGDHRGPPALLLAGLSDGLAPVNDPRTRAMLRDVPLPMERFRGLVLSYPTPLPSSPTTRSLAGWIADAVRRLIDEPALVVAHSLGAMVAQHLAADAPELVRALVLSAPVGRSDAALRAILRRWDDALRMGRVADFHRDALETSFTGAELDRRRNRLDGSTEPSTAAVAPPLVERHLALSAACASHDALGRLGRIGVPTLLLAGAHDEVAPVHHAEQVAARIPRARLVVVDDAGHAFPEQRPQRFAELVSDFLRERGLGPPSEAAVGS